MISFAFIDFWLHISSLLPITSYINIFKNITQSIEHSLGSQTGIGLSQLEVWLEHVCPSQIPKVFVVVHSVFRLVSFVHRLCEYTH